MESTYAALSSLFNKRGLMLSVLAESTMSHALPVSRHDGTGIERRSLLGALNCGTVPRGDEGWGGRAGELCF